MGKQFFTSIQNDHLNNDINLYSFSNDYGFTFGFLWWKAGSNTLQFQAYQDYINIMFDGTLSNKNYSYAPLKSPVSGGSLMINKDQFINLNYFEDKGGIFENNDFLILNNVTLASFNYKNSMVFDLRCDWAGGQPHVSPGYLKIMMRIDITGNG